jgi:hypothetical protein
MIGPVDGKVLRRDPVEKDQTRGLRRQLANRIFATRMIR